MITKWELRAVDDDSAELILWDSFRGCDTFIRLDGRSAKATVRDCKGEREIQDLVMFLNDFAQVCEMEE